MNDGFAFLKQGNALIIFSGGKKFEKPSLAGGLGLVLFFFLLHS